jgi:hypothetical protein
MFIRMPLTLSLVLMLSFSLSAVELTLTNGQHFKGNVVSENDATIKLNVNGQEISIRKALITSRSEEAAAPATAQTTTDNPTGDTSAGKTRADSAGQPVPQEQAQPAQEPVSQPAPEPQPMQQPEAVQQSAASAVSEPGFAPRKVTISLGILYSYNGGLVANYKVKRDDSNGSHFLQIMPAVGIMVGKITELRPAIGIGFSNFSDITEANDTSLNSETVTNQFSIPVEIGVNFYVVNEKAFRFSLGPAISERTNFAPVTRNDGIKEPKADTYVNLDFGITVPFHLDLILKNRCGFSMSGTVIGLNMSAIYEKDDTAVTDRLDFDLSVVGFTSWFSPEWSFFVLF